mmetsp:Transcript_66010/g.116867  ORF Transcript_66010/g.116867 Transcript_66010/m.116867 type:complete len:95 (-) Transcript_66010:73-357(-)
MCKEELCHLRSFETCAAGSEVRGLIVDMLLGRSSARRKEVFCSKERKGSSSSNAESTWRPQNVTVFFRLARLDSASITASVSSSVAMGDGGLWS